MSIPLYPVVLQTKRSCSARLVTAATGLSLATAPDVAHYLPFLASLLNADPLASGIATVLAPAFAIIVFMIIALTVVYCKCLVQAFCISTHDATMQGLPMYMGILVSPLANSSF